MKKEKSEKDTPFWEKYIWNFRDLANLNPNIIEGKLFRSNLLASVQNKHDIVKFLEEFKISTILDLRANHEVRRIKYKPEIIKQFNYINIAFDPYNYSKKFSKQFVQISEAEIAYNYFIKECKPQIKRVFDFISNNFENPLVIHCIAGKDRTGIIVTLIHLLSGLNYEEAKVDYLATNHAIDEKFIQIVINEIIKYQGIENYLYSCKIEDITIKSIKKQLFKI